MTIRWTKLCLDLRWQVQNSLPGAEPRLRLSDKPLPGDHTSWPVQKKYVDKKNELKLLSKDKIIWKISPKDQLSERSHVFRDRCICYEFYECTLYLNYYTVLMLHPTSIYCRMSRDVESFHALLTIMNLQMTTAGSIWPIPPLMDTLTFDLSAHMGTRWSFHAK